MVVGLAGGCFSPTGSGTSVTGGTDGSGGSSSAASTTSGEPGSSEVAAVSGPQTDSASPTTGDSTGAVATTGGGSSGGGAVCGNGVVETGEECDMGVGNGESVPCTPECKFNVCGDGYPCPDCGEECDDGNAGEGDGCSSMCRFEQRYVFVTSASWAGKALGGLSGADMKCNGAAQAAKALEGRTFRAWLSTDSVDAISRIGVSMVPYVRLDNMPVAQSSAQLVAGMLENPIEISELGEPAGAPAGCGQDNVWTGTVAEGTGALENCMGWVLDGVLGRVGNFSAMDSSWTDCGDTNLLGCGMGARLYCVQVAP